MRKHVLHRLVFSILTIATLITAHESRAQVFIGPASAALGAGGRAAVDPGEASFLNPAAVALIQRYHVSGFFGVSKRSDEGEATEWGALIADGTPDTLFPGAVSFVRRRVDLVGGGGDTQTDIQLSAAGMIGKRFAFGLSGHRLTNQLLVRDVGSEYTQYNMGLGILFVANANIGLAATIQDLLPGDSAVPEAVRLRPTYGLGFNFIYEKFFRVRLDLARPDANNPERRINVSAGIESVFADMVVVRLGSFWRESADQTYVTAGLGYKGPRLSLDYSFQKDTRNADNQRHLIDLWIPL